MKEIIKSYFFISQELLDMNNCEETEDGFAIPLICTEKNQDKYDELYCYIGEKAGFLIDITYSKLFLNVELNTMGQFTFSISAKYVEFSIDEVNVDALEKYDNQISVCLTEEELTLIYPVLVKQFSDDTNLEDLRLQVVRAVPGEYMNKTSLFAEEVTQTGYRCVWVSEDRKRCVLAEIGNRTDSKSMVKAYIF